MRLNETIRHSRKNKHLNWEERIQIETLQREGCRAKAIGEKIGRSERTIRRELKRGWVLHRLSYDRVEERYSADRGRAMREQQMSSRRSSEPPDQQLLDYLYCRIVEHRESPAVVAFRMKEEGADYAVCEKTIYNLITQGKVPGVSDESLWEKRKRKQKHRTIHRQRKRTVPPTRSIENRPEEIEERQDAGHWEIDLVVGGKGQKAAVLLTLTERKSRKIIIRKLKNRKQASVIRAINGIERQLGRATFSIVFKSITADNGSEFIDYNALEQSVFSGLRTHLYYAHPYSSWERGSNENGNRIIRRFIPKGCDISTFTRKQIQQVEEWINNYPRKILNFKTANERFNLEIAA